jgi:hypothetical protein
MGLPLLNVIKTGGLMQAWRKALNAFVWFVSYLKVTSFRVSLVSGKAFRE